MEGVFIYSLINMYGGHDSSMVLEGKFISTIFKKRFHYFGYSLHASLYFIPVNPEVSGTPMEDAKSTLVLIKETLEKCTNELYNDRMSWCLFKSTSIFLLGVLLTNRLQKVVESIQ